MSDETNINGSNDSNILYVVLVAAFIIIAGFPLLINQLTSVAEVRDAVESSVLADYARILSTRVLLLLGAMNSVILIYVIIIDRRTRKTEEMIKQLVRSQ